ncbi:MAG: MarR family transcriptional regulator [Clostridiaceae bacterium]|nr:MarR family transcriptional regulator [Clostridiaceae bacterium]
MTELEQKAYIFGTIFTLSNKLQALGDEFDQNITTKQWLFMIGVSTFKESPMISELANFIGYSRQNAKRIAAVLQKKGYITLAKDQYDARAQRIELTQKCKTYFAERDKREIEFLEKIFAGFDAGLTDSVYTGLCKLDLTIKAIMMSNENAALQSASI